MLLTLYKKYRISFKIIKITAHILSVYIWIYIKKSINCMVRSIYILFTINTMKNINLYEEIMNWDKKPDQLYTIFRNYFADEKMSVLNTKYHILKTKFTEKIIIYIIKNKKNISHMVCNICDRVTLGECNYFHKVFCWRKLTVLNTKSHLLNTKSSE